MPLLDDPNFQDELLTLIVHDRAFLHGYASHLTIEDFAPTTPDAPIQRWQIAGISLDFWRRYGQPVGRALRLEAQQFIKSRILHEKAAKALLDYADKIIRLGKSPVPTRAVADKIVEYKREKAKLDGVNKIINLMQSGELTDDAWLKIMREAVDENRNDSGIRMGDYIGGLDQRIQRRKQKYSNRLYPALLIDGFDEAVRGISYGHLGLVMAPYGRGKGLMLIWVAMAYAVQGLSVLFFTLEDQFEDVEDRLDAATTRVPIKELVQKENLLRDRHANFKVLVKTNVRIFDGTEGMTISEIESVYHKCSQEGFRADAIVIDYDEFVRATKQRQKRFEEFDEIYRDLLAFLARTKTIGWIASQTGRGTEEVHTIRGDEIAGDMGKIRKATLAVSLGQGDWGDESIWFWIEKHRLDKKHFGFNLLKNEAAGVFYDRYRTLEREQETLRESRLTGEATAAKTPRP
jgi:hypothetical protein